MAPKAQQTGTRAVHLVCAKLIENDFTVTVTSRNADYVDILAFKEGKSYGIQVKANAKNTNFWLVGKNYDKNIDNSYYYVFVNLNKKIELTQYYTLSSADVRKHTITEKSEHSVWYSIMRDLAEKNHDNTFFERS